MEFVELRDGKCLTTYSFSSMDRLVVVVVVFTLPLPGDESMAGDHGASEARQLHRAWNRGHIETENCQRASAAKSP